MTNEIRAHLRDAESELEHAMDALLGEFHTARLNGDWSVELAEEHQMALEAMRTAWDAVFTAYRMVPGAESLPWGRRLVKLRSD